MTLIAMDGTPLFPIGAAHRNFNPSINGHGNTTLDAALEACIMIGHIRTSDGQSHTIDTSGSSMLEWRSGVSTFANAGTSVKVGLAAVDATAGPPARAVNVADAITFDVSKTMAGGGGGVVSNTWHQHVPDAGSKTIANGDLVAFCVQMVTRGGADSVLVNHYNNLGGTIAMPMITGFVGAAYSSFASPPNAVITFADGAVGYFFGGNVATTGSSNMTIDSDLTLKEGGNLLQFPFPVRCYGIYGGWSVPANHEVILYSDPLGTPVAEKTITQDLNQISANSSTAAHYLMFPGTTPYYDIPANTPVVAAVKGSSSGSVMGYKTFFAAAHQASEPLGANCYAVTRNTGAFAQQNSGKDRAAIGLLVGGFDGGVAPRYGLGI
jgi:hypothetical protein